MRRPVFSFALLVACVPVGGYAIAQPPPPGLPSPRLQSVFPCGVKAGASVEVTVTGFDTEEPESLLFSHPGLKAEYVPPPKDPVPDPKDPKKTVPPPKANPAGPHKFKVTAGADVPPGLHDVRFVGKWGVSNPRAFAVGDLAEVSEKEPNNDVPEAQKVELGTVVNGVIANPTDVDYCTFAGKKGQRVVVACLASSIDSRAAPLVEVYDAGGRKLAANRNYRDDDAVLDFVVPSDGDYSVRVCQFTYTAGGPEYIYRLSVSAAPWIDAVFPPVVEPGKAAQVTLYGRNLPGGQPADFGIDGRPLEKLTVTVTPPTDAVAKLASATRIDPTTALQDGFAYTLNGPGGASNPVVIYLARDNLTVKAKPAPTPESAEVVPVPGEVAGFIAKRGAKDWVAFNAKKGERFTIDLAADRIGSSGDFFFSVRDGKDPKRDLSGELDDDPDALHPFGFFTRASDPAAFSFTAPEEGKYFVAIGSRDSNTLAGPVASYRLRIAPPKPDFRAVVMPYSRFYQTGSAAWQGGAQTYHVFAHRVDGYTGALEVVAEGLPKGVTAKPLTIGPAARWGVLVLDVAPDAGAVTTTITVKVTGTSPDGKKLVRDARPASVTWGTQQPDQNIPVVARLDRALPLAVRAEKAPFRITTDIALIVLKQGGKSSLPVKVEWAVPEKPSVNLVAEPFLQQPQNSPLAAQPAGQPTKEKPEVVVNLDARPNAVPGVYSLVLRGVAQVPFNKDPMAKQKQPVPAEEFCAPIPVQIIPNAVAKLTVVNIPNNTLKLGGSAELTVKVERLYGFDGEIAVKLDLPKGVEGIAAEEVTIPAGANEVKLVLEADEGAKPGAVQNATVVATANYDGKYAVTHEAKVSFNVVK